MKWNKEQVEQLFLRKIKNDRFKRASARIRAYARNRNFCSNLFHQSEKKTLKPLKILAF